MYHTQFVILWHYLVKTVTTKHKRVRLSLRCTIEPGIAWLGCHRFSAWTASSCVQHKVTKTARLPRTLCTQIGSCWTVHGTQMRYTILDAILLRTRLCFVITAFTEYLLRIIVRLFVRINHTKCEIDMPFMRHIKVTVWIVWMCIV